MKLFQNLLLQRFLFFALATILFLSSCSLNTKSSTEGVPVQPKPTIEAACAKFQNFYRAFYSYSEIRARQLDEAAQIFKELTANGVPVSEYVAHANTLALFYRTNEGMDYNNQAMVNAIENLIAFCPR